MQQEPETFFKLEDVLPALRSEFEKKNFDLTKLIRVAVAIKHPEDEPLMPASPDRSEMWVTEGKESLTWKSDPLGALFRGDKKPAYLGAYPEHYNDSFGI